MADGTIRWEQDADGVVVLTLDDAASSANTMNEAWVTSMGATLERLDTEKASIRGVVITSAKKTFFAGGDLSRLIRASPESKHDVLASTNLIKSYLRRLETLGVPVSVAINGAALGGGLEIALACHHRVVLDDPTVRLGFPEVTLGLLPGAGGIVRSVRLLGLTAALLELLLQGQQLRPDKALQLGLVHELAADRDQMLGKAKAWVLANQGARQPWDSKDYRVPGGTPSSPSLAANLPAFPANLTKQLKGAPYPAPHAILAAAVETLQVDVDTAFVVEGRYFVDLAIGQISTNMIQALWFDLNRINGGGSRPATGETYRAQRVGVLGAGMMGAGIAHAFSKAGVDVVFKDVSRDAAEEGRGHVEDLVTKQVRRGRMSQQKADAFLARITPTEDAVDLAGCDVVVEAVFEDQALKHRVLHEAEQHAAPGALMASNTSTLPITGLADGVNRASDVVGMHFFSPVDRMPLVELIVGERTSDAALARAYDVVRQIGKTPIVVRDSRGFFTSRVFGKLVPEGAALLADGAAPMSVERAALQAGFPSGPLTLLDEVSLTLPLKASDEAAKAGAVGDHPGLAVLRTLVERDRVGKAGGHGFFDWTPEKRMWPGLSELFRPKPADAPDAVPFVDAQERLLFAMALESARCLEEQVLHTIEDANIGSIMAIGFPPMYGGALQYIDQYNGGVVRFVSRADELAERYGERFRPPCILLERAVPVGSLREAMAR